jgi:hypothetical protein
MSAHVYITSAAGVREMLRGGGEFVEPAEILSDLTEAQALTVPAGSPHSIAQIVSHMQFYQGAGRGRPRRSLAETGAPG